MDTIPLATPGSATPDWSAFRRRMPAARRFAYFDHAAVAPLSEPAQTALIGWCNQATHLGDTVYPEWMQALRTLRATVARMIHAEVDEIGLLHNTTEGINVVAEGFPWQAGDNVVTLADEFPSNQYPWLNQARRGVEIRRVPVDNGQVDLARIEAACDHRTRIVSLSWVGYASGRRNDLAAVAELVHRRGALLFVDAIQGLGVFPLDVRAIPIDFLAADGHKWLLGPEGAAVFYIRREHLNRLQPLGVGWNSVVGSADFTKIELTFKPTAERYEGGSPCMVALLGLKASIDLLMEYGQEAISRRVIEIADLACRRLAESGAVIHSDRAPQRASGIVGFAFPGRDPVEQRRACLARDVVLSCRAGRLRISPHAYNNADDVERLVEALR